MLSGLGLKCCQWLLMFLEVLLSASQQNMSKTVCIIIDFMFWSSADFDILSSGKVRINYGFDKVLTLLVALMM